jgi:hypothetical protein
LEEISSEREAGTDGDRKSARTAGVARTGAGIPLYSGGKGAEATILVAFEPIDFLRRPAPLMYVQGAYALLVDGSSMVPALEPGDVALVNPRLFPRKGANVLFLQEGEETDACQPEALRGADGPDLARFSVAAPKSADLREGELAARAHHRWKV